MSCKIQINQHPATSNQQLMNYIRRQADQLLLNNYRITRSQLRSERSEELIYTTFKINPNFCCQQHCFICFCVL